MTSLAATGSPPPALTTFASLRIRNYRLFAIGQIISNTGAWAQRIAQDWLVLTLTGSATAVGVTATMQFIPYVLFGMGGGWIADHYPKRMTLLATQVAWFVPAAALAILTFSGHIQYWHVWICAFVAGSVSAVDGPTRASFVHDLVGPAYLRNAVSINSTMMSLGGLVAPPLAGALFSAAGPGWSFAVNALSFIPPMIALRLMRESEMTVAPGPTDTVPTVRGELRGELRRPEIWMPTLLAAFAVVFIYNLPVALTSYAKSVLHTGPAGYGLLSATVTVGSVAGALISARGAQSRLRVLFATAALLAIIELAAAGAPNAFVLYPVLAVLGGMQLLLLTSTTSRVQLAAAPNTRGRVMAFYMVAADIAAMVGGILVGTTVQHFGPRAGFVLAGTLTALGTLAISAQLIRRQRSAPAPRVTTSQPGRPTDSRRVR